MCLADLHPVHAHTHARTHMEPEERLVAFDSVRGVGLERLWLVHIGRSRPSPDQQTILD